MRSRRKDEGDTRGAGTSGVGKHIQKLAVPPYLSSAMLAAAAFSQLQGRGISNGMAYFDGLIRLVGWSATVWHMMWMYSTYLFCAGHDVFCGDVYRIWVYTCDESNSKAVNQLMLGETENSSVADGVVLRNFRIMVNDDGQITPVPLLSDNEVQALSTHFKYKCCLLLTFYVPP